MKYTPSLSKETQENISGLSRRLRLTTSQTLDKIIETFTEIVDTGLLCEKCQDETWGAQDVWDAWDINEISETCDVCGTCICNSYMYRLARECQEEEALKRQLEEGTLSA
jgi:hypothetical protein